jgi:hypothetical protein
LHWWYHVRFGTLDWCCIFTSLFIHTSYLPFQLYLSIKFNHLILKFELSEVLKTPSFWHHMWKVKCGHFNSGTKLNMCRNWWVGSRHLPVTFWRVGPQILRDWSSPILQVLLNYMESKVESYIKFTSYLWSYMAGFLTLLHPTGFVPNTTETNQVKHMKTNQCNSVRHTWCHFFCFHFVWAWILTSFRRELDFVTPTMRLHRHTTSPKLKITGISIDIELGSSHKTNPTKH